MTFIKSRVDINPLSLKKAKIAGLKTTLKILPVAQSISIVSALVISIIFYREIRLEFLMLWCELIVLVGLIWIRLSIHDYRSGEISRKNPCLRHMIMAGLSSGLFGGFIYLLFPLSMGLLSLFLGVFAFSLLLTGAFVLSAAPPISMVWVICLGAAILCSLTRYDSHQSVPMMTLMILFIAYVIYLVFRISYLFQELFIIDDELRIFKRAIENTPASVVITDTGGAINYVNPAFSRVTGYSPEETIGQNPRILKSGMHNDDFYRKMWEVLEKGQTWNGEISNKKKDGSIFWELASISPICDERGGANSYVAVKGDITDKKDIEMLKEDVDRIMRHDLKQPLSAIIAIPQLLKMKGDLNPEQVHFINRIEEAGSRMLHMIDLSLDMFKMETGKYQYRPQRVDVIAVVSQVMEHARARLNAKKLECRLAINGKNPLQDETLMVFSEERLLYSLLSNLFINAIEASPDSSVILIEIVDSALVSIAIHNKGAVPKVIRNCFFDKYKTFGKAKGTGLGTYSVKLLASAMHHEIRMETSDEEDKTCITICCKRC